MELSKIPAVRILLSVFEKLHKHITIGHIFDYQAMDNSRVLQHLLMATDNKKLHLVLLIQVTDSHLRVIRLLTRIKYHWTQYRIYFCISFLLQVCSNQELTIFICSVCQLLVISLLTSVIYFLKDVNSWNAVCSLLNNLYATLNCLYQAPGPWITSGLWTYAIQPMGHPMGPDVWQWGSSDTSALLPNSRPM